MIGETLGNYRVVSRLGMGGMGAVYIGEHTRLGRKAAIKVLLPELSRKQEMIDRFFNEARASTAIGHPGIVQTIDFGEHHDGSAFLVMELLTGEALNERLDRLGRLNEDDAVRIARQCASALAAAHAAGIIHRDLKPANIFLATDPEMEAGERVKILDFGIAKLTDSGSAGDLRTRTGSMMGTPAYMSPEQCRGAGLVDHRSDIYSLGCVIFRMVCGRPPFVAEGAGDIIASHLREPAPSPRAFQPALSTALEAVVQRALAKSPDARFSSMAELATVLQSLRQGGAAQHASVYRRPDTPEPALAHPAMPMSGSLAMPAAGYDQPRPLAAGHPAPAVLPPGPPQRTAFPTPRPSSGTAMATTPISAHLDPAYPRAATPDPTTLGAVASQRMHAVQRRNRRGLLIGVAVAVGSLLALLVVLADDEGARVGASGPGAGTVAGASASGSPPSGASPAPAGGPVAAAGTRPGPGRGPEATQPENTNLGHASENPAPGQAEASAAGPEAAALPRAADAPAAPPPVRVLIESDPSGASVHAPGKAEPLGNTPFEYERPAGAGAVTLTLQHEGYQPEKVEIPAGRVEPLAVTLERSAERPAERRTARKPERQAERKAVRKPEPKSNNGDDPLSKM
jgi:tRNA A-37 threonylcarbamoyl transferase component Bud32